MPAQTMSTTLIQANQFGPNWELRGIPEYRLPRSLLLRRNAGDCGANRLIYYAKALKDTADFVARQHISIVSRPSLNGLDGESRTFGMLILLQRTHRMHSGMHARRCG